MDDVRPVARRRRHDLEQRARGPNASARSTPTPRRTHSRLLALNGVVSLIAMSANYLLYICLVELASLRYLYSHIAAGGLAILINFSLSRWWVYRDTNGRPAGQFIRYLLATVLGIGMSTLLLYLLVDLAGLPYWIAWGFANVGVFAAWTYPSNRYIVYPWKGQAAGAEGSGPPHFDDGSRAVR